MSGPTYTCKHTWTLIYSLTFSEAACMPNMLLPAGKALAVNRITPFVTMHLNSKRTASWNKDEIAIYAHIFLQMCLGVICNKQNFWFIEILNPPRMTKRVSTIINSMKNILKHSKSFFFHTKNRPLYRARDKECFRPFRCVWELSAHQILQIHVRGLVVSQVPLHTPYLWKQIFAIILVQLFSNDRALIG